VRNDGVVRGLNALVTARLEATSADYRSERSAFRITGSNVEAKTDRDRHEQVHCWPAIRVETLGGESLTIGND
jgi:hypothetical protein